MESVSKPLPVLRNPSKRICSFHDCGRPQRARGLCGGHYQQNNAGKPLSPLAKSSLSDLERFMEKVEITESCWVWVASTRDSGKYGYFRLEGKGRSAHCVAYEIFVGSLPMGMQVDHICHNTLCVRPEHLRTVTNKQNQEHRISARVDSKSGIRGVGWYAPLGKWRARVSHYGRMIHVGYFDSEIEAEQAVVAKRRELFTHNDLDRTMT